MSLAWLGLSFLVVSLNFVKLLDRFLSYVQRKWKTNLPSILPEIGGSTGGFVYNSWRIFLLVMSLPSFLVAALLFLLPESPKFLITTGRQEEALEVFRSIYLMNTGRSKDEYPVKQILIDEPLHTKPEKPQPIEPAAPKSKMRRMFSDIVEHSKQLFVPPILKFTMISITINFTFHIG